MDGISLKAASLPEIPGGGWNRRIEEGIMMLGAVPDLQPGVLGGRLRSRALIRMAAARIGVFPLKTGLLSGTRSWLSPHSGLRNSLSAI